MPALVCYGFFQPDFWDEHMRACRNLNAIIVFFPQPSRLCHKWQLACEGGYTHIIYMPGVFKEATNSFLEE